MSKIRGNDPTGAQRVIDELTAVIGGTAGQLRVSQSITGLVEEDGYVKFAIYLNDIDSGQILSTAIDITSIVVSLKKSTGGGSFSSAGITQPTFSKSNGQVAVEYRFLAAEWSNGDGYSLDVSGISVTIGTDTAYVDSVNWCSSIVEDANVENKIDTIDSVVDGIVTQIGTPVAADISADIANVQTDTTNIIADIVSLDNVVDAGFLAGAKETTLGTPTDTDIATDISNLSDDIATGTINIEADAGTTSTSIIDAAALTQGTDDWWKGATLISIDGQNGGQARNVVSFDEGTDALEVYPAFLNTPDAGDNFILLASWRPNIFDQQPAVAVNTNANIAAVNIFDLNTTGLTYMVNSLRIKCADPGANTVTLTLYELINGASVAVDTFEITTSNYTNYFSLYDMFSVNNIVGDDIQITLTCNADGNYAVTGQYQYARTYTG